MKTSAKTPTRIWKEKYEELKTQFELLKNQQDLQPNENKQQALRNEIISGVIETESKKNEISNKEEEIVVSEEKLKTAQDSDDSSLIEQLEKEKENLENQLKEKIEELLELQKQNKEREKQLDSRVQELQDKIGAKKQSLEDKKGQIKKGVVGSIIGKITIDEKELDRLFEDKLEIAKLEAELENIKGISQIFNIETAMELPRGIVVKNKLEEDNFGEGDMNYHALYPEVLLTEFSDRKTTEFPTKLIDISGIENDLKIEVTNIIKVKDTTEKNGINYAILSYSWDAAPWGKFRKGDKNSKDLLHAGSKKSLRKAIKACKEAVKVNYLWIDTLCIDQQNKEELVRELSEVRKYYSNAKVTLIAIQAKLTATQKDLLSRLQRGSDNMENVLSAASDIIVMIVKSEWFQRSWTFQEGLLSPQTVFMFDDYLVDGRFLAMAWSIKQNPERPISRLTKKGRLEAFLQRYSKKIATPIGWSYYHDGYSSKDTVYLNLFQALEAIKNRKRYIALDGIYSVIGLLPYKVEPKYKAELWGEAKHDYKEEDVAKALMEVMKVAVQNGYGEPLSWYGESSNLTGLCWLPRVLIDGENTNKNGSMNIEKVIKSVKCKTDSVKFLENDAIKIEGSKYNIIDKKKINGTREDKLHSRKILVKIENSQENKWVRIQGIYKSLEKIKVKDTMLLLPNMKDWKSDSPIALLVEQPGDKFYHRIDLVTILEGLGYLTNKEEELIIGMRNQLNLLEKTEEQYLSETHSYIELPPKK